MAIKIISTDGHEGVWHPDEGVFNVLSLGTFHPKQARHLLPGDVIFKRRVDGDILDLGVVHHLLHTRTNGHI